MSQLKLTHDIGMLVRGMETSVAVILTVNYIRKTQKFDTDEAARGYWAKLSNDEKLAVVTKALAQ